MLKPFPIYLGYAGMFFSGLKIVLPDQKPIEVDPTYLEFKKTILLVLTMIVYGATILKVGFFFINFTFFGIFILFFRRKKMEIYHNFLFSIRCNIYVSPTWSTSCLS